MRADLADLANLADLRCADVGTICQQFGGKTLREERVAPVR